MFQLNHLKNNHQTWFKHYIIHNITQTTNYKYKTKFTITLVFRLLCGCGTCRQNVKGVKIKMTYYC